MFPILTVTQSLLVHRLNLQIRFTFPDFEALDPFPLFTFPSFPFRCFFEVQLCNKTLSAGPENLGMKLVIRLETSPCSEITSTREVNNS